jgi:hypothetical protein
VNDEDGGGIITAIAAMARHLHTPIGEIEDMEWDRFDAYSDAVHTILRMESGKPTPRKQAVAEQIDAVMDDVFQRARTK